MDAAQKKASTSYSAVASHYAYFFNNSIHAQKEKYVNCIINTTVTVSFSFVKIVLQVDVLTKLTSKNIK